MPLKVLRQELLDKESAMNASRATHRLHPRMRLADGRLIDPTGPLGSRMMPKPIVLRQVCAFDGSTDHKHCVSRYQWAYVPGLTR